jgi:ubiquinone/menaquinone biosynthesis C-methylase UbiE
MIFREQSSSSFAERYSLTAIEVKNHNVSVPLNWYENFFHGVALDLWRKAVPPEHAKAEADFLIQALHCDAGSHLLDVPCGNGRLSRELASRGYRVTGVDIAEEFIEEARVLAQNTGGTPVPQFMLGDMRTIEGEAIYDGAYCFGNSFGFLAYADMEKFLNGVARALKPGARFIIETGMAAESAIPKFTELESHQIEDILLTIKEQYLATEGCIDTEYVFERNGVSESRFAKHWIYTAAEISRMLERAGFAVVNLYGSLRCEPFVLRSDELLVVAERL